MKKFRCVMCNFSDSSRTKFLDHVMNDHEKPAMKRTSCQFCDFKTSLDREMKDHAKTCRTEEKEKVGEQNPDSFESPSSKKHRANPAADEAIQFSCKSCSFVSSDRMAVVQHFMDLHVDRILTDRSQDKTPDEVTDGAGQAQPKQPDLDLNKDEEIPKPEVEKRDDPGMDAKLLALENDINMGNDKSSPLSQDMNNFFPLFCQNGLPTTDLTFANNNKDASPVSKGPKKLNQCRHCRYSTFSSDKLTSHMVRAHAELTPIKNNVTSNAPGDSDAMTKVTFECHECGFVTRAAGKLKAHMVNKHNNDETELASESNIPVEASEEKEIATKPEPLPEQKADQEDPKDPLTSISESDALPERLPEQKSGPEDPKDPLTSISESDALFAAVAVTKSPEAPEAPSVIFKTPEPKTLRRSSKKFKPETPATGGSCGECNFSAASEKLLASHKKKCPAKAKPTTPAKLCCQHCDFQTTTPGALAIHVKHKHKDGSDKNKTAAGDVSTAPTSTPSLSKPLVAPQEPPSGNFNCSKCCTFKTSKLFELAFHFRACAGSVEEKKADDQVEVPEKKVNAATSSSTILTESGKMKLNQKESETEAEPSVPEDMDTSIESDSIADDHVGVQTPANPDELKDEIETQDSDPVKQAFNSGCGQEISSKKSQAEESGSTLRGQENLAEPAVSSPDEEGPVPKSLKYQCSKCCFGAERLQELAAHFVACARN